MTIPSSHTLFPSPCALILPAIASLKGITRFRYLKYPAFQKKTGYHAPYSLPMPLRPEKFLKKCISKHLRGVSQLITTPIPHNPHIHPSHHNIIDKIHFANPTLISGHQKTGRFPCRHNSLSIFYYPTSPHA